MDTLLIVVSSQDSMMEYALRSLFSTFILSVPTDREGYRELFFRTYGNSIDTGRRYIH